MRALEREQLGAVARADGPLDELVELDGLGHMGPITHPDKVNELIGGFLERHSA